MQIRRAGPSDAEAIADVFIPSFESLTFLPQIHTHDQTRGHISRVVAAEEVWVAEDEGDIVVPDGESVSPIRAAVEGRREIPQISAGDTVQHDKWGEGVVLTVSGSGSDAEATVRFEDAGEKRLLVAYAPLRKVG